jgi:hypothetical protein
VLCALPRHGMYSMYRSLEHSDHLAAMSVNIDALRRHCVPSEVHRSCGGMGFTCHSLNRSFSVAPLDATLVSGRFRSQMSIEWLPKMNNGGAVHVSRLPCSAARIATLAGLCARGRGDDAARASQYVLNCHQVLDCEPLINDHAQNSIRHE